jgi:acyl dehydratase
MGRYYEEFEIGACYETPRRTILDADIVQFAGLTADYNPLHTDDIFASQSDFGGRIAHGPMLVGMAFGLASRAGLLDGTALALLNIAWTFTGPVRPADTIVVRVHVVAKKPARKSDRGVVDLRLDIVNQRDETVQTGTAKILIKRKSLGAAA